MRSEAPDPAPDREEGKDDARCVHQAGLSVRRETVQSTLISHKFIGLFFFIKNMVFERETAGEA